MQTVDMLIWILSLLILLDVGMHVWVMRLRKHVAYLRSSLADVVDAIERREDGP